MEGSGPIFTHDGTQGFFHLFSMDDGVQVYKTEYPWDSGSDYSERFEEPLDDSVAL